MVCSEAGDQASSNAAHGNDEVSFGLSEVPGKDEDKKDLLSNSVYNPRKELNRSNLQQDLDHVKLHGKTLARQRQWELQQAQIKFHMAETKLREQLLEKTHHRMYMKFLRFEYHEMEKKKRASHQHPPKMSATAPIVSPYVLQQEAPLLSVMHRAFLVLPNQMEVTKLCYERHLYPYFHQEIRALRKENAAVLDEVVELLSAVAEENDQLYDSYQQQLEKLERTLRDQRRDLRCDTNKCRVLPLLSETEHSETEREDDISSTTSTAFESSFSSMSPLSPGTFPKWNKILLTPEKLSNSINKNVNYVRKAAEKKFQLPF